MDDKKIIELYFARDKEAITNTDVKYGKYLFTVAYNVLCDRLDCEECLNDTYLGAWNAIPPEMPNSLKAFLTVIIRRIAIKRYHKRAKKSAVPSEMTVALGELEGIVSDGADVFADFDAKRLGEVITEFVRSLSERKRYIFMSRYYGAEAIGAIASALGISKSTVNKELSDIRYGLRKKLESEGY